MAGQNTIESVVPTSVLERTATLPIQQLPSSPLENQLFRTVGSVTVADTLLVTPQTDFHQTYGSILFQRTNRREFLRTAASLATVYTSSQIPLFAARPPTGVESPKINALLQDDGPGDLIDLQAYLPTNEALKNSSHTLELNIPSDSSFDVYVGTTNQPLTQEGLSAGCNVRTNVTNIFGEMELNLTDMLGRKELFKITTGRWPFESLVSQDERTVADTFRGGFEVSRIIFGPENVYIIGKGRKAVGEIKPADWWDFFHTEKRELDFKNPHIENSMFVVLVNTDSLAQKETWGGQKDVLKAVEDNTVSILDYGPALIANIFERLQQSYIDSEALTAVAVPRNLREAIRGISTSISNNLQAKVSAEHVTRDIREWRIKGHFACDVGDPLSFDFGKNEAGGYAVEIPIGWNLQLLEIVVKNGEILALVKVLDSSRLKVDDTGVINAEFDSVRAKNFGNPDGTTLYVSLSDLQFPVAHP